MENKTYKVGDRVRLFVDGLEAFDTITYINGPTIEGEVYDLTYVPFEIIGSEKVQLSTWHRKVNEPLPEVFKSLIIEQMKVKHRKRYGVDNYGNARRKTYDCEHLWDDLQFILNHLHV